jgi:hypothetical protein
MSNFTDIPYSTLNDIVNNRVVMEECQYKTLRKISEFVNVPIDELVYQKEDFQTFRNKLHHKIKSMDELELLAEILQQKEIDRYYRQDDVLKALYLLSTADYISRKNNLPFCMEYSDLRRKKLKKPYYVGDLVAWREDSNCIREFVSHNIYEGNLYDAI